MFFLFIAEAILFPNWQLLARHLSHTYCHYVQWSNTLGHACVWSKRPFMTMQCHTTVSVTLCFFSAMIRQLVPSVLGEKWDNNFQPDSISVSFSAFINKHIILIGKTLDTSFTIIKSKH